MSGNRHDTGRGRGEEFDPLAVLGLDHDAGAEEIRAAYLRLIREHPPDKEPDAFERIRDAHDLLCDPMERVDRLMVLVDPTRPLEDLIGERRARLFTGPDPWLAAMGGR